MSRKWERMVVKNSKEINKRRKKQGQQAIGSKVSESDDFFGRSIFFSMLFIGIAIMYGIASYGISPNEGLYWFTVIAYFVFGLYFFYLRRPVLRVYKDKISTRKMGREQFVQAGDIDSITAMKGYIVIKVKNRKSQMVFSKMMNLYDTNAMADRLKSFAEQNRVEFVDETNK